MAPEDGETGASIHSSRPSLFGPTCRGTSGLYLLTDEHPSTAQEKAEYRDPPAHVRSGTLAIVHGTIHRSYAEIKGLRGMWHSTS